MISSTGNDLEILIECEHTFLHHWMAFATWYSCFKNLPDAKVFITCKVEQPNFPLFQWVNKVGLKFSHFSDNSTKFKLSPNCVAVKDFSGLEINPAKSNESCTFIDYSECGKFSIKEWEKQNTYPFFNAVKRFSTDDITINELKVLKLFEKMFNLCRELNGT